MPKAKRIEAEIKTASGTTIVLKGDSAEVLRVIGMFTSETAPGSAASGRIAASNPLAGTGANLSGIAETDGDNNVHIVVADLKAKNILDAAKRLIYTTLFARRELLKEAKTDRKLLNKVLESYNLYDGNTRNIIPRDRALVKEGRKFVTLSAAALPTVRKYVQEIQDPATTGKWHPTKARRRRRNKKVK
jgi:hypothetical protein